MSFTPLCGFLLANARRFGNKPVFQNRSVPRGPALEPQEEAADHPLSLFVFGLVPVS